MSIIEGATLTRNLERTVDVCIIGSGAGGSVLAARLAAAGRSVVVLEEGGYHTRADFLRPDERWSYPNLYQERGARATADQGITILQGRAVGGGTLVNWTTCFRTPEAILAHWRAEHGTTLTTEALASHFDQVESRLGVNTWPEALANGNNDVLKRGCEALGWEWAALRRNVRGCANTGLCGLGCPVDAKQAMHLTFLADAQADGAEIYSDVRVESLQTQGTRVDTVHAVVMERGRDRPTPVRVRIRPTLTVLCGGAINSPAVLLRSGLGNGAVGRRTFFHPTTAVLGKHPGRIAPFAGAPQSISSHQHLNREGLGFFLEVAPLQPMLAASAGWAGGEELVSLMADLPQIAAIIALHVDGLHGDEGGTVTLHSDGRPRVDYPISPLLQDAFKASHDACARVHFAAGALEVATTHPGLARLREADLPALANRRYGTHAHAIFTAHQMGGCAMGADPTRHVVDLEHRVRGVDDLFVVDGSIFPTGLGVNPSQTIYGLASHAAGVILGAGRD